MDGTNAARDIVLTVGMPRGELIELVRTLEERGEIDKPDTRGLTPLLHVLNGCGRSSECEYDLAKFLVKHGADAFRRFVPPNNKFVGWSPFEAAVMDGRMDFVGCVVDNCKDLGRFKTQSMAALNAVKRRDVGILATVLTLKCPADHVITKCGGTALRRACECEAGEDGTAAVLMVQLLLLHGADAHRADAAGVTPLAAARRAGHSRAVDIIERQQAQQATVIPPAAEPAGPPPAKRVKVEEAIDG